MINSRKLEDLHPKVKELCEKHIAACDAADIDLLITSTYRDIESQNALYAQGRTTPGNKVTNAKGGQSFHNWKVAYDVVPIVGGKAIWDDDNLWRRIGKLGTNLGLEWAGNWKTFRETAHFQLTGGLTIKDFQDGKRLA